MSEAPLAPPIASAAGPRHGGRVSLFTKVSAAAIAAFVSIPLFYLVVRAAEAGRNAWSLHVLTARTLDLLWSTFALVAGVLVLSIAIALPYAWLVTRSDLPFRQFWAVLGALPLAFPSYIAAFAVVSILGPRGTIASAAGIALPEVAYGYSGALIALGFFSYPYLYLLLAAAMRGLDPLLEEAARSLGRAPLAVFREVVVPQLRAPLAAGSLMIALYTMSDFGAVSITRYDTFTTAIYDAYRGLFDRTVAALLATILALLTIVALVAEWHVARKVVAARSRVTRPATATRLGRWRAPALLFVGLIGSVTVVVPFSAVVIWSLRGTAMVAPRTIANSLTVSAAAAVACVVLSIPVSIWATRGGGRAALFAERLTFAGYALPGIVIALALVVVSTRLAPPLYQTVFILGIAYVIRFLPEAVAATRSALANLAPVFEEAARSLGRSRLEVLRRVTLPMIRPGLLAGGGLVFLTAMKELPATLILRPTGFETLATRIWSETSVAAWSAAALPSLLLVLASVIPLWILVIRPAIGEDR